MNNFPYTYDQIEKCQKAVKEIESDIESITKLLRTAYMVINKYSSTWKHSLKKLDILKDAINEAEQNCNDCNMDLLELEEAANTINNLGKISDTLKQTINDIRTINFKLQPLTSWRLFGFLKKMSEEG